MRFAHTAGLLVFVAILLSGVARGKPFVVVIDAGHGGQNMGAVGPYGVYEKYITLAIALKLGAKLEAQPDIVVLYTRKDDVFVSLEDRIKLANSVEADAFISIHCNASPSPQANGFEVYYFGQEKNNCVVTENFESSQKTYVPMDPVTSIITDLERNGVLALSQTFAEIVLEEAQKQIAPLQLRDVRQGDFVVLRLAKCPAIVAEVGFITHPEEGMKLLLAQYQDAIAKVLADAILKFKEASKRRIMRAFEGRSRGRR
jgi:N-acetylmuramoyl-L-alanine amidase